MKFPDKLRYLVPDRNDLKTIHKLEQQVRRNISSVDRAEKFVSLILDLFHEAFIIDNLKFIRDVLFENQLVIRRTLEHQEYVSGQFKSAKRKNGIQQQIQLANVYRNAVADLFDPYISVLVACIEIRKGRFVSFLSANLGAAEFNKFQYVTANWNSGDLFGGYKPIIRNAVSHAGSHSIEYKDDEIIFRKISRGKPAVVADYMKTSTTELSGLIQDLLDFTEAMNTAINLIGLDLGERIVNDKLLTSLFKQQLVRPERHALRRKSMDADYALVWNDRNKTFKAKLEHFTGLYVNACKSENMPLDKIRFNEEQKIVIVEIPVQQVTSQAQKDILIRIGELVNYAALAEFYFHFQFMSYLVEEAVGPGRDSYQVWLQGPDLKAYNERTAHMIDLLHDGKVYKNKIDQPVNIDFNAFDDNRAKSLTNGRDRKKR